MEREGGSAELSLPGTPAEAQHVSQGGLDPQGQSGCHTGVIR